ncbi:rhomboid-related protein 3-like [Pollicipes pollicipes]|uniref:rhomboid-related protein 3-like n=1 Tax=Pollicipes pollicipes TaxID=41117 RepID=UPI0018853945|nr:rhomboid-related protein 3-like [Pollicipes pollicipes]XP_037088917.1 rhomboid-related protein 3-like [Pollicipes pollicipes]XP_037088918.1 rhomboid-related protein 3-like [Pollicipes pollicipes]XP_037088919.1 rhomboid-related protein 3-like [Pollicipes pollicipes]
MTQREETQVQMESLSRPDWRAVFDRFDLDHDGEVPLLEFRRYLSDPQLRSRIPDHVLDEILARADTNIDGSLSFQEFLDMVQSQGLGPEGGSLFRTFLVRAANSVVPKSKRSRRYLDQYSCCPPPVFMVLVSVVELVLFIVDGVRMGGVTASGPVDTESVLIYSSRRRAEAWRFLSYMFVHVGYVHITTNLVVQLLVGLPLELVHRWWRVAIVYLCGVLAGSLGTSVFDPKVFLAGASGGVYAILAAHLADLIMNWAEMELAILRLIFLLVLVSTDVGVAVYGRYSGAPESTVSYTAHLAGALAGVLIGNVVLRNLRVHRWERVVWWASLVAFLALVLCAVVVNVAAPDGFYPEQEI